MTTPRRDTLPIELVRNPPREWYVLSFAHEILPRHHLMLLKFRFAADNEGALFLPPPIVKQLRDDLEDACRDECTSDEPVRLRPPPILPRDRDSRPGGINRVARSLIVHCDDSQILLAALLDSARSIYQCVRLTPLLGQSLCAAAAEAIDSKLLNPEGRAVNVQRQSR